MPQPGVVVSGRYRLESLLGQGGMGSVWRAHHLTLNAPVAIKLIDPALASSPDAQARFIREAQAAAALRSPNVVQTLDFGVDDGIPYIVMELLIGENLADRLARVGRLTPAQTARVVVDVAKAIGKAHASEIVHRDLKPDNVFLARDEDDEVVKVVDFGVAKATGMVGASTSRTRTGAILGTPYYMSPEQAQGDKRVDWRTDLWALAVIAFECLVGRRPFEADGLGSLIMQICASPIPVPSAIAPVPPGFDAWWARATEREPAARFQSARELATTLRAVLGDDEAAPRPGSRDQATGAAGAAADGVPATGTFGGAPVAQAPTPYPELSGSQPGAGTVTLDTGSGAVVAPANTANGTTTAAVARDAVGAPRRSGKAVALAVGAGVLVLAGGAAAIVLGVLGSGDATPGATPSAAAEAASAPAPEIELVVPERAEPPLAAAASGAPGAAASATPPATATPPVSSSTTPAPSSLPRAPALAGPLKAPTLRAAASATKTPAPATPKVPATRKDRLGF